MSGVLPVQAAGTCTLHGLVEGAGRRSPEAVAARDADRAVTYAELCGRAGRLARHLAARGVARGDVVGILLPPSVLLAEGLLATLGAGAVCLPLDGDYPRGRIGAMVQDARPVLILTTAALARRVGDIGAPLLDIAHLDDTEHLENVEHLDDTEHLENVERLDAGPAPVPAASHDAEVSPGDLAYLVYTSGSTGTPKGVMLPHAGLANHAAAAVDLYGLGDTDRMFQISSVSFDISIEEMFPTWAAGGCVVFRPQGAPLSGRAFVEDIERQGVTVLDLPTALWRQWVHDLEGLGCGLPRALRTVIVGGEKAQLATLKAWKSIPGSEAVRWFNTYGPTETSVVATAWEAPRALPDELDDVPLGSPIANVTLRVLGPDGRPVAAGEPGELYIGGPGVAAGYHGRPELTAERFVPGPPEAEAPVTGRFYRTGDVVLRCPDGSLRYQGRNDEQVKIGGFRVEPQEVETVLGAHPEVREAAVVARQSGDGRNRLVAYTVPRRGVDLDEGSLLAFLSERLPLYMVPAAFVTLEAMPLTPNGKVDRRALPVPTRRLRRATAATELVAPGDRTERELVLLWQDLLDVEPVGVEDDFFEIGGQSLDVIRMLSEVEIRWGCRVPMALFLEHPTISAFAVAVRRPAGGPDGATYPEETGEEPTSVVPVSAGGLRPPLVHVCNEEAGAVALRHFVAVMGPEQPVYALILRRIIDRMPGGATIEELADAAAADLARAVPAGPYVLSGYSLAGLVAHRMACILTERGAFVPLLALLDTWAPDLRHPANHRQYWARQLRARGGMGWRGRITAFRSLGRSVVKRTVALPARVRAGGGGEPGGGAGRDEERPPDELRDAYWRYRPAPYTGRVALFRTRQSGSQWSDGLLGWDESLAPHLKVVEIPGGHGSILRGPNVEVLAGRLAAEIARCTRTAASRRER